MKSTLPGQNGQGLRRVNHSPGMYAHRRFIEPKQVLTAIDELPHCRNGREMMVER